MSLGGALFMHRLWRICTSGLRAQQGYRQIHRPKQTWNVRTFSAGPKGGNENGDERENDDSSPLKPSLIPRQGGSLFGRRRPLSPLERISRLLPQESLSPEVAQLREQNQEEPEGGQYDMGVIKDHDTSVTLDHSAQADTGHTETYIRDVYPMAKEDVTPVDGAFDTTVEQHSSEAQGSAVLPPEGGHIATTTTLDGERLLTFGELLVAEYRKKGRVEFRKMFQLEKGVRLQSSWGTIGHDDMAGKPAGSFMKTTLGMPILIRRASLEDYVLYMKRGPAIAYPKDASTMLMMMDVTEGDCVLEAGSGSGAMALFLSRAVASRGSVLSLEVREDHHRRAVLNYNRWRASWSLRRGEEWPDNVQFCKADLCTASSLLAGRGFNSVALDMISPHLALPAVTPHLHPGAVCAVYLANITQVIDLLEGLRCTALPLLCERIIEVPVRDWLVAPAIQKDGRFCIRKAPIQEGHQSKEEEKSDEEDKEEVTAEGPLPFGSVPYIARPHPEQMSHTAFLVRLRKSVR